jgi:hypothetical protein
MLLHGFLFRLERPERRIPGSASVEFNTPAVMVARRLPLQVDWRQVRPSPAQDLRNLAPMRRMG